MTLDKKYSGRRQLVATIALLAVSLLVLTGCSGTSGGGAEASGRGGSPQVTAYTVTFNTNGGTGNMAPQTFAAGVAYGSYDAFEGKDGYQITDADLTRLQPVVTDLPDSMTSPMGMSNGATVSTAPEGNTIKVRVTPK